jgi:PmbA protein
VIPRLLELINRSGARGDLVAKQDETLILELSGSDLVGTSLLKERGVHLRLQRDGKIGIAGTTDDDADALVASAVAATEGGPAGEIPLPDARSQARVVTKVPRAAAVAGDELRFLGQMVVDRLAGAGRRVSVTVERSVGSVRVANSGGLDAGYETSLVALLADVTLPDGLRLRSHVAAADLPEGAAIERLVDGIKQRILWSRERAETPRGHLPVCFLPTAVSTLLGPARSGLLGRAVQVGSSPFAAQVGTRAFDPSLTISDEPLIDGRPGSRPFDDEGITSARHVVVDAGVVRGLLYDLESAGRAGVKTTGHARRTTFGRSLPAWSNLVVEAGPHSLDALLAMIDDGLLIDSVEGDREIGPAGGFALPVGVGWRVRNGEVVGRVKGAVVAGNAYEILARLRGIGRDTEWRGSESLPPMAADEVAVVAGG